MEATTTFLPVVLALRLKFTLELYWLLRLLYLLKVVTLGA